jgi:metal-responsive CopG/Arc/MetJ family transcriptional regulator
MPKHAKVAISVPTDTYDAVERARARLGLSRSEVVATALRDWLQGLEADATRKRYVAGYLRVPESGELDDATRMIAVATADWSSWKPARRSRASERRGKKR